MKLKRLLLPERVKIAIMSFFAITIGYIMRACLSIAITQMVQPPKVGNGSAIVCPLIMQMRLDVTKFDWTQTQQGLVLSSFYIGYVITHIPGGILSEKFGGKWILSLGVLSTAIFTLLIPIATHNGGYIALVILRIFVGLGMGTMFPAISVLLAAWVPEKERSEIGSFVYGGAQIGSASAYLLTGLILDYLAWDYVFYIWGGVSVIWFVVFTFLCYNDPASDPSLSKKEHDYLELQIGHLKRDTDLPPTPWKHMIKSVPVIALIFVHIGHDWCSSILITYMPKYYSDIFGFEVFDAGLYSALPYLVMWIVSVANGFLSDYLTGHEIITITFARKIFYCGSIFTGTFLVVASYSKCDRTMAIVWFVISMAFMGMYFSHIKINPIDLSPNYAGILMAFSNGIGSLSGVAGPAFAGYMTPNTSIEEWRTVFWVTFGILTVTAIIFCIGASGEVQPWNFEQKERESDEIHELHQNDQNKST